MSLLGCDTPFKGARPVQYTWLSPLKDSFIGHRAVKTNVYRRCHLHMEDYISRWKGLCVSDHTTTGWESFGFVSRSWDVHKIGIVSTIQSLS